MELVTPSHGQLFDTFIMYGIIRSISESEQQEKYMEKIRIKPEGEYYIVQLDRQFEDNIKKEFFKNLYQAFNREYEVAHEKSSLVAALQGEKKLFEEIKRFLEEVKSLGQTLDISKLYGSLSQWKEWRSNKCGLHKKMIKTSYLKDHTVQLSLSPQLGKYLYKSNEGIKTEQQKACSMCTSLALLGILSYSIRMRLKGRSGWQFATFLPTKETSAKELSYFRLVFGKEEKLIVQPLFSEKIPELIIPLLLLKDTDIAVLEIMQVSLPILFTYRFDPTGKGGVFAVRKVSEYPASKFIDFYLHVRKLASNEDIRFLNYMKNPEYSPYFSELALSILTDDVVRFYNFLRGFATETARRIGKPAFFSQAFVEQALHFFESKNI
ncbi:MAG: hypothetical protein QXE05_06675 [Nitrososphaeria archaeon]